MRPKIRKRTHLYNSQTFKAGGPVKITIRILKHRTCGPANLRDLAIALRLLRVFLAGDLVAGGRLLRLNGLRFLRWLGLRDLDDR